MDNSVTLDPKPRCNTMGVDPGFKNGGVVLLKMADSAPHSVVAAWAWTYRQRKAGNFWEVLDESGTLTKHSSINEISGYIVDVVQALGVEQYVLTLEGLYIDSIKKGPTTLKLAESAGESIGPLRALSVGPVERPTASKWRAKVLRLGRASAATCAARAIQCAPLLATGLGALSENEHACEALCIAYYGGVLAMKDEQK